MLMAPMKSPAISSSLRGTECKSESRSREEALWEIALGVLKWGVVSPGAWTGRIYTENEPGHLAFAGPGQDVYEVVDGSFYAGHD